MRLFSILHKHHMYFQANSMTHGPLNMWCPLLNFANRTFFLVASFEKILVTKAKDPLKGLPEFWIGEKPISN